MIRYDYSRAIALREAEAMAAATGLRGGHARKPQTEAEIEREREKFHRADRKARRKIDAEERGLTRQEMPRPVTLAEMLAQPDEDVQYRVDRLLPVGGHAILVSAYKAGKTTTVGNIVRSLVDGDKFLGKYDVATVGKVAVVDDEMDERTLRRWYRDFDMEGADRVTMYTLRGALSTFDLMDDAVREEWVERIQGHDVLVVDCLRPILDALGLDENRDTGRFLVALDALVKEAGVGEVVLVQHMGHSGERARGDSRLQDWPDVTWKIIRDDPDDPNSLRYFSAFGRDVNEPEQLLTMDDRRNLTVSAGGRNEAKVAGALEAVLEVLKEAGEPLTAKELEKRLEARGVGQKAVRDAVKEGRRRFLVKVEKGAHNANLHSLDPAAGGGPGVPDSAATPVDEG
ncbi:AAA family ATPase [Dietzia maris]